MKLQFVLQPGWELREEIRGLITEDISHRCFHNQSTMITMCCKCLFFFDGAKWDTLIVLSKHNSMIRF